MFKYRHRGYGSNGLSWVADMAFQAVDLSYIQYHKWILRKNLDIQPLSLLSYDVQNYDDNSFNWISWKDTFLKELNKIS